MSDLIEKTVAFVKSEMATNDSSHDWYHIERVRHLAKTLALREGLDEKQQLTVELCALLHDIKDWKYDKGTQPPLDPPLDSLEKSHGRKEADMSASNKGAMGANPHGRKEGTQPPLDPLKKGGYGGNPPTQIDAVET